MLIELMIAMIVLAIGLGGIFTLLTASMFMNAKAGNDSTSTMLAEHVIEQVTSQPANAIDDLQITDCAGNVWNISTVGSNLGTGSGGPNGGNGASLKANGTVDWTQAYAGIPAGYAMQYVSCGTGGRQTIYDVRWNVIRMTDYTRAVVVSARPASSASVGGLQYVIPVNLRTIGGM
jgi:type II secretory pathway pseudopilin PulG